MLKQLYFVPEIMARYRCRSEDTARRYMRQMGAKGRPLFVTEDMIDRWELERRKPCWTGTARPIPEGLKIPRRK